MIKRPEEGKLDTLKLNVYLKDGREYLECDTTPKPFGEHDRIVAFWYAGALYCIPMSEVRQVTMMFD